LPRKPLDFCDGIFQRNRLFLDQKKKGIERINGKKEERTNQGLTHHPHAKKIHHITQNATKQTKTPNQ
jgi:hypothetical protein